jgi:hypothetical protein
MTDDFKLTNLPIKTKKKLLNFYNVSSIDELEVKPDGNIVLSGGGRTTAVKLFLEDHNKKLHELKIDPFLKKQKKPSLGFDNLTVADSRAKLQKLFSEISKNKKEAGLSVFVVEHGNKAEPVTTLFQQLIIFYSNLLKNVLCGNKISEKYIRSTGNPGYSDVDFYNVYKDGNNVIIKGFAFCIIKDTSLFVDVICGTGGTGDMVRSMHEGLSQVVGKPKYISLESIETVEAISFYTHLGFKKKDSDLPKLFLTIKKSKEKDFESFAKKNPKLSGGLLYLDPPASLNASYVYDPVSWFAAIKSGSEPKLVGEGIGSFFKSVSEKVKSFVNRLKPNVSGFTNQSKTILGKYGKGKVVKLVIIRQPIMGVLDTIINGITFGAFQKAKKKYGYDKLFHLQLAVYVKVGRGTTKIVLEKNETVDMSVSTEHFQTGDKEFQIVPFEKDFTLEEMVDTARTQQGDQKFFEYDAFTNNCQWFIGYLLHGQELYGPVEKAFLFQDLNEFNKDLPKWLPGFARKVTDLGATVANLRGKGRTRDFSRVRPPVENVVQTGKPAGVFAQKILDDMTRKEEARVRANLDRIQQMQDESIEKVKKEFVGGIGVQRYITPAERAANRNAAVAVADANKSRGVTWVNPRIVEQQRKDKEASDALFARQQAEEKARRTGPKTIRDYQAEERQRKAKEVEDKRVEEQIATNTESYRKTLEEKRATRDARKKQLSDEYKEKRAQLKKDIASYKAGRIDDIQDTELRSRAQTERNLSGPDTKRGVSYYSAMESQYTDALKQQQEQDYLNLIPAAMQLGISYIPKVGDKVNSLIDATLEATGADKDTSSDARRAAIIEAGPFMRPDVLEGYEGEEPTEPDWNDQVTKEGYGMPLHAVIIKKDVPFEHASNIAKKYIGDKKKYFRETKNSYRFRNISKQKFDPKSFRTQVIDKNLSLVFGKSL